MIFKNGKSPSVFDGRMLKVWYAVSVLWFSLYCFWIRWLSYLWPQYLSCMSVWLDIIFFDIRSSCSLAVRAMRAFFPWSQNVLWLRMMYVLWWRLFRDCTWADPDPCFDGFSWVRFTERSLASSYLGGDCLLHLDFFADVGGCEAW